MELHNGNIIKVKNLYKRFGTFEANKNLTFDVKKGEIFGFLGANGAGKTTTIKILSGLSHPSEGEVNIAGFNIYTQTQQIRKTIGYMSQKFSLYDDLTVYENIRFYGGIYGLSKNKIKSETEILLQKLNLANVKNKLIGTLPQGWKQKLAFSIAILHNPAIVFLDEPTGGVDPITRRRFWELIYEASYNGITVFVTTHYMDEAEYCDRLSIMADGEIKDIGTPKELMLQNNAKNMDDVFIKIARNK